MLAGRTHIPDFKISPITGILLAFLSASAGGQVEVGAADRLFLWEIETGDAPSYICGSVHMMSPEQFPLPEAMDAAYLESQTLVVEADVTRAGDLVLDPGIMVRMYYEGKTVMDVLPPDILEKTEKAFEEMDIPLAMFYAFKPWVLASTLVQMRMQQLGYSPELGLDYYFLKKAHGDNKKIVELESAAEQIELMSSLPEAVQITLLEDALLNIGDLTTEIVNIFRVWESGDTAAMHKILEESRLENEEGEQLYSVLIDERNKAMAAVIANLLETKDSGGLFIVIGAAHLIGEGSVLEELEKYGYTSRQMDRHLRLF